MNTLPFWTGFLIGATANALLVIVFCYWQDIKHPPK
jgi:hypothetical protein